MANLRCPRGLGVLCLAMVVLAGEVHGDRPGAAGAVAPRRLPSPAGAAVMARIRGVVAALTEDALKADVLALQQCGTRYAPSRGNLQAARYAKDAFVKAGLADAAFDEFSYLGDETGAWETTRNVTASLRGTTSPDRVIVIGAHFDTVTRATAETVGSALDPDSPSPGADDNATGTAAVLAAARLLAPHRFDRTIRFVLFSAEEAGIFGSARWARGAARRGEQIEAMINLDMLGFVKDAPEDIDVLANRRSTWLLDRVVRAASVYAPDLLVRRLIDDTYDGSDHGPFWHNGYPAVCFMDDYYPSSRLYHTPEDTVDRLDGRFFLDTTRLAIGLVAELAGMRSGGTAPSGAPVAPIDWHKDSGRRWLVTLQAAEDQVQVSDVSLRHVTASQSVPLSAPSAMWSDPRNYPVSLCPMPGKRLVYVPSVRLRPAAGDAGQGRVRVVDPLLDRVKGSFQVGPNPAQGAFDAKGTRYYQPYFSARAVDVFDTATLRRVKRIHAPAPLTKIVVDENGSRAVGISAAASAVFLFDLARGEVEAAIPDVASPSDVVLAGRVALVSGRAGGKIYTVDLAARRVVAETPVGPAPVRLIPSPTGERLLCLHQRGTQIDLFDVGASSGAPSHLKARQTIDLHEAVVDAAFAGEDECYFVSTGKARLVGLTLSTGQAFWAMRTGGVRARADTDRIAVVGRN